MLLHDIFEEKVFPSYPDTHLYTSAKAVLSSKLRNSSTLESLLHLPKMGQSCNYTICNKAKKLIPYRNVKVVTSLLQGGLVAERLLQPGKQVVTILHCGCHSDLQPCKIVAATLRSGCSFCNNLFYNLVKDMASAPQLVIS